MTETAAPELAAGEDRRLFSVEHVTLRFGGVTSLNDVSLELHRGEILVGHRPERRRARRRCSTA